MASAPNLVLKESSTDEKKTTYTLKPLMELRFEVDKATSPIFIQLEEGTAEIFGAELVKKKKYEFRAGAKAAVFTWHGCVLELEGQAEVAYPAQNQTMVIYVNVHEALDQMRVRAQKEMNRGPRVLIAGPQDVGKSTLCKMLVNYAARRGWCPMLVDLDVGQNEISIPGTVGAISVNKPSDVEDGYLLDNPLIHHFGHKTPSDNITHYKLLVSKLAESINMKSEINNTSNTSGVVINTCGWIRDQGYSCILHASSAFEIEVLIVMDQELLYTKLKEDLPEFVKVILLPKSGGVVERSKKFRSEKRDLRVKNYFYGIRYNLHPHTFEVKFADVQIYKIGAPNLPNNILPLGMIPQDNCIKPVPVTIIPSLAHHVLSCSYASSLEDDVVQTNVAGFVVITKVNMETGMITLLSPEPRPFSWNILLLMENITYLDLDFEKPSKPHKFTL